jgi:hypothetical protein
MKTPTFTDRAGCTWTFQDYRVADDGPQPVELNDRTGEYRAFSAVDGETRLVYRFGALSYRTTEPNVLESQLLFAKPITASKLEAQREGA